MPRPCSDEVRPAAAWLGHNRMEGHGSVRGGLRPRFAEGFEAAAVTAFGAVAGSAPPEARYDGTYARVDFDRPFDFLAVHRPSRLAVVAGWMKSPFQPN